MDVIEACVKVIIAKYVLFWPVEKSSKYYKKYFQFHLYIFLKKSPSQQIKEIFPLKVWNFQYDHRFLFSREKGNIRSCMEVRLFNLLNLGCQENFRFGIFPVAYKMRNHLGWVYPSHFLQNVSIKTLNIYFKNFWISYLVLYFFMPWSLEDWKYTKRFIFDYFL